MMPAWDEGTQDDKRPRGAAQEEPCDAREAGFGLVEALVSIVILSIGLLAVGGMTLAVAQQSRLAAARTDQTFAAEEVLGDLSAQGYSGLSDEVASGEQERDVQVGARTITVTWHVTSAGSSLREIRAVPETLDGVPADTFVTRVAP